jgi:tetratricopeptide (TPR) repeat protein
MKKLVVASAMALASVSLVSAPALRAQDNSQQITIQNPAEFNAYQQASTQTDPAQKAAALESFLSTYPQSVVKKAVLDELIVTYQGLNQPDKALSAATRLLQIDPNNMRAIYISVYIKKADCQKSVNPQTGVTSDAQTCDDAATLAQKGLTVPKPADTADADWKKLTDATYPLFHSTIALDDEVSKKDMKGAIDEYRKELDLYPLDECSKPGPCLVDTLQLAEAYARPGPTQDQVQAVWFYARAWNFAPTAPVNYKAQIEPKLEYWYKRFHGTLDGEAAITQQISAIKSQAQATLFPPANFAIKPAPTPSDVVDNVIANTPDLKTLNLEDKEFILANGSQSAKDKLWAVLQGQLSPVPGVVVSDPANVLKVSVTTTRDVKPKDYVVKLQNPGACGSIPEPPTDLHIKEAQDYILANGVKADTDAMGDDLTDSPAHFRKISIEPAVSTVSVAVTEDAKNSQPPVADFIVNLKDPESCKDAPAPGTALATQPALELDGTYSTYTPVAAANGRQASAQIVLSDGFLQLEKKATPVHHTARPPAGHHAAGR